MQNTKLGMKNYWIIWQCCKALIKVEECFAVEFLKIVFDFKAGFSNPGLHQAVDSEPGCGWVYARLHPCKLCQYVPSEHFRKLSYHAVFPNSQLTTLENCAEGWRAPLFVSDHGENRDTCVDTFVNSNYC